MRLRYAKLSTTGPVRPINEDWLDFGEPQDPLAREKQGSVALLADGVGGGFEHGEVASRMAVDESGEGISKLRDRTGTLRGIAPHVHHGVHGRARRRLGQGPPDGHGRWSRRFFAAARVFIAHVGDSRAYLIRQKKIRRLTTDHAATTLPVKLRLVHERQAMASPQRSQLVTRSVGTEPYCQPDFVTQELRHGDFILHCTDGLHAFVLDEEICEIISRHHPYDACRELEALTLKRGGDDNISLQILEVRDWERVATNAHPSALHRQDQRAPRLHDPAKTNARAGTGELAPGMLLDNRFELTDTYRPQQHGLDFQGQRSQDRRNRRPQGAAHGPLESDVAGYEPVSSARGRNRLAAQSSRGA